MSKTSCRSKNRPRSKKRPLTSMDRRLLSHASASILSSHQGKTIIHPTHSAFTANTQFHGIIILLMIFCIFNQLSKECKKFIPVNHSSTSSLEACRPCQQIRKHERFKGIQDRLKKGIYPETLLGACLSAHWRSCNPRPKKD